MNDPKDGSAAEKSDFQRRRKIKRQVARASLLALVFVLVFSVTAPGRHFWKDMFRISGFGGETGAPLSIRVLDVGKADAVLLECEGHAALIDAGTAIHGETIVDCMARNGIASLEYAIVSHPDEDHIGGMTQVLSEADIGQFIRSRYFGEEYEEVESVLQEEAIPERIVFPGDTLALGSAVLTVLGPTKSYPDTNNASLVFRLEYHGFTALFCGDIEEDAERDLVKSGVELSSNLLKVPHHGSDTSCTWSFLKAVDPEYAVISVGKDNNYLPKETILERLDDVCLDVYRTDTDGTITFTYHESEINIQTERKSN